MTLDSSEQFRRIATEEAFSTPNVIAALERWIARAPADDPDAEFQDFLLHGAGAFGEAARTLLIDLDDVRLQIMDANGIDMQLLSLTSPGVQTLDDDEAAGLAAETNDLLAEAISRHPDRFAGLAAIAPQAPARAVEEIERAMGRLGLNGIIINSHTRGEYLDEDKFWPILEAAEDLGAAIYLHPRCPSAGMAQPMRKHDLVAAIWGFQADTGLHAMRLMSSGVFDRFPRLTIVLGHMGEAVPYWLHRIDRFREIPTSSRNVRPHLELTFTEYLKRNFYITTSGMPWDPALKFNIDALGADNIMFAVDYPYEDTTEAVRFLDNATIAVADKHKIYHENAERVFRIQS
ncbi:amidohydrolase family protein [Mycobacterium sp. 663a-19]|uniref:amidohydrolase family protein n=1 Tax=Mycobacterium sp. 663a-19 TaxID=2986148 RepID=UPI002D1F69FE|nr:amidohydrolase family protein [Mycobacterium sp. 663a-19]MEB3980502.1 amidohydrolase family protein [Mycobacterium sp. 663a-19]